jgi:pimeloyl-ACP methyl ester carboxylesterase
MATIELLGNPTWAKIPKKKGATVLLLHGGMSSSASMLRSIGPELAKSFGVAAFDRRGHGRTGDTDAEFHYDDMASEVIAFIEMLGRRVHLVGHSDGGNIALVVAMHRPDLLKRVVVIGANFHHDGLMPLDIFDAESAGFAEWAQKYARTSPDGIEHARVILEKTMKMTTNEPNLTTKDLAGVTRRVLVMAGDDDVATLTHTTSMYEAIPDAQLAIVPGTSHALLKERTKLCARLIKHFLTTELPEKTYMPVRRRKPVE